MSLCVLCVDTESLAASVEDAGGCYFVPAFCGLFCPYWQSSARGYEIALSVHGRVTALLYCTIL